MELNLEHLEELLKEGYVLLYDEVQQGYYIGELVDHDCAQEFGDVCETIAESVENAFTKL